MKNNKFIILLSGLVVLTAAFVVFIRGRLNNPVLVENNAVTQDNASTTVDNETADWLVYRSDADNIEFKYPAEFGAVVWHPQFWPPKAAVVPTDQNPVSQGCPDMPQDESAQSREININGINYTLYHAQDAGAGQLYSSYCYIARKEENNYVLYFAIWSVNGCGNGNCGPSCCGTFNEAECKNLDRAQMIEKPIEKIVSTFKF